MSNVHFSGKNFFYFLTYIGRYRIIFVDNILFIHYKNILTETLCVRVGSKHWGSSDEQEKIKIPQYCKLNVT